MAKVSINRENAATAASTAAFDAALRHGFARRETPNGPA
jgi:hypothetical protein